MSKKFTYYENLDGTRRIKGNPEESRRAFEFAKEYGSLFLWDGTTYEDVEEKEITLYGTIEDIYGKIITIYSPAEDDWEEEYDLLYNDKYGLFIPYSERYEWIVCADCGKLFLNRYSDEQECPNCGAVGEIEED